MTRVSKAIEAAISRARRVTRARGSPVPVAAYQVSGEFAMIEAAAANGWLDRDRAIMETLTAIRRAGAGVILTYWAAEVARRLGVQIAAQTEPLPGTALPATGGAG